MHKSNTYTYMWQPQKYTSWKGDLSYNQVNVVIPNEKRPIAKAVETHSYSRSNQRFGPISRATSAPSTLVGRNSRVGGIARRWDPKTQFPTGPPIITGGVGARARYFGPQPLKHWRLQLNPDNQSGYSKMSIANSMDRPGSAIIIPSHNEECFGCDLSNNSLYGKKYIKDSYLGPKPPNNSGNYIFDSSNNIFVCIACNPETNRIKSAVTLLKKNYYTNTSSYLKSRCMTYDQKQTLSKIPKNIYLDPCGNVLWPNNECGGLLGPQAFYTQDCPDKCQSSTINCNGILKPPQVTTIYKPNNRPFQQQGAVSSSGRIAKLKYDTITKNGASFRSAYGAEAANAGRYTGASVGPYFIKNKVNICYANIFNEFIRFFQIIKHSNRSNNFWFL